MCVVTRYSAKFQRIPCQVAKYDAQLSRNADVNYAMHASWIMICWNRTI